MNPKTNLRSPKSMTAMNEMDLVFKRAKEKAIKKSSELGNTTTPWKDFTLGWLKYRLAGEFKEWDESRDIEELLDIINLAAFVYLAVGHSYISSERLVKE